VALVNASARGTTERADRVRESAGEARGLCGWVGLKGAGPLEEARRRRVVDGVRRRH